MTFYHTQSKHLYLVNFKRFQKLELMKMKGHAIFGALLSLLLTASATPNNTNLKDLQFSKTELRKLANIVKSHGLADRLAADQSIICNISYTLALSIMLPPQNSKPKLD